MWKNMIFWIWEVQKGTSSLHREMERPSEKVAWGEAKIAITYVKFEFPTYDGELNAEKLDSWIKKIEVYCRVQKIVNEAPRIQLVSLRLSGTTLIWWESKMQVDLVQKGKFISSWDKFTRSIRKQFYPLAYTQTTMIEW
jgi:hypothetical protein